MMNACLFVVFGLSLLITPAATQPRELLLSFDFGRGSGGWLAGFSDYHLQTGDLQRVAEVRPMPPEIDDRLNGYYLQSMNRSDDLFMFLKKELSERDGLAPDTSYQVVIDATLASNAPSGCLGIGGAPGESVYLKMGVSPVEPVTLLDDGYVQLNIDKGAQSGGGMDAGVAGNIANGRPCDEGTSPYVLLARPYRHPRLVRTDDRGVLWVLVGTDSGFEGLTGLYYDTIKITLRPV